MFPLHEELGQSLSWDHLSSPEELIPHSEGDHLDAVLEVALTPRQLFPDIDASSLQTSIESDDDDVFNTVCSRFPLKDVQELKVQLNFFFWTNLMTTMMILNVNKTSKI